MKTQVLFFSNQIIIMWGRMRIGKFCITNNIVDLLQKQEADAVVVLNQNFFGNFPLCTFAGNSVRF